MAVACALVGWGLGSPVAGQIGPLRAEADSATLDTRRLLFKPKPMVIRVAGLARTIDSATVTDVEVADFDGDGRNDIAVAWYATDLENSGANQRVLSVYAGTGPGFRLAARLNLFVRDPVFEALSVFRNGTAEIGTGDFDGDGDLDLAVTPFFGDELWLIENLGEGGFAKHLRFPFGFNSPATALTPPEALSADFDGDGRVELAYIADPIQHVGGRIIHFWKTDGAMAEMQRVEWEGLANGVFVQWTRGLAVGDFDSDGRSDLCFSGTTRPPFEEDPILVFWHDLDVGSGHLRVHHEYPTAVVADVVDFRPYADCPPGVILTDLDGASMQYWAHQCDDEMSFWLAGQVTGYAAISPNRGMAGTAADVNGDGCPDLVTKQKLGTATDPDQIEVTLGKTGGTKWKLVHPTPIDTRGFENDPGNEILRPRNLAVGDLFGNTLPEIVAGFGASSPLSAGDEGSPERSLDVAIWANSCMGDVSVDGVTDERDLTLLLAAFGTSAGDPRFNPDADLDKDGCVGGEDLLFLINDFGCRCCGDDVPVSD